MTTIITFKANNIVIVPSADKPRYQEVTFTAEDKTITRREAENAMGEKKRQFVVSRIRKVKQESRFPKHWGSPPKIQTRDYRKLPGDYGYGSSTLASWIIENLKKDKEKEKGSILNKLDKKLKEKGQWHLFLQKKSTPYTQV